MALVGALSMYGLYFAGFHDTPEKMATANWIGSCVGIVASVICLALAMRDRRNESVPDKDWGYGSALGTGVLTGLVAAILGAILAYIYFGIVNTQFSEVVYQAQVAKMEAKGLSSSQIDAASGMMHKMMSPVAMTIFNFIGGIVWATILSLIVAIFFRKRALPADAVEMAPPPMA